MTNLEIFGILVREGTRNRYTNWSGLMCDLDRFSKIQSHNYIHESQLLKFADDAKCFIHIRTLSDHKALQDDITALLTWSRDVDLDFSLKRNLLHSNVNVNLIPLILCPIQLYLMSILIKILD